MYNNPFIYGPYMSSMANLAQPAANRGLLSGLKAINWSTLLSNTQKTLGIINQTIPIVYQVKPILNNAKAMFKIVSTLKEDDKVKNETTVKEETNQITNNYQQEEDKPMFFI